MSEQKPLAVGDAVGKAKVVQIDVGTFHGAALLSDGRVVCWGKNGDRQCNVPKKLGLAIQVAAGFKHTVALLSDGRVVCWGNNDGARCDVPKDLGPAVRVAAGGYHTAALLADGRTQVWGQFCGSVPWKVPDEHVLALLLSSGSALLEDLHNQLLARLLSEVVKQKSSGGSHTAALLADGRVACWGSNDHGQCNVPADLGSVMQVAAGRTHTAALLADGDTRVWGRSCNDLPWEVSEEYVLELLLGSGSSLSKKFGDQLLAVLPSGFVKHTAAGEDHTAALLSDGRVVCWGRNTNGQCDVPVDLGRAALVSAGHDHTAAWITDGGTRVWGRSCDGVPWRVEDGQALDLLRSSGLALTMEFARQLLALVPSSSVKHTAGGKQHTAALLSDGRVMCWGDNDDGQCSVPSGLGPAVQVAAGVKHTAALLADGRVVCWGSGGAIKVPKKLPKVTSIACGASHAVALSQDGRVLCWGSRAGGKCDVPESIQGRAAAVHAEGASTWAVDVDGRLHGWGEINKVDSLPFELTDDSWLEFATRTWGRSKQKIYPEHIRKSAAFKAIRTMHKLAEG